MCLLIQVQSGTIVTDTIWPESLKYLLSGTLEKVLATALEQHKITIKDINTMNLYSSCFIVSKCINKNTNKLKLK